jgi:hypothetical protein
MVFCDSFLVKKTGLSVLCDVFKYRRQISAVAVCIVGIILLFLASFVINLSTFQYRSMYLLIIAIAYIVYRTDAITHGLKLVPPFKLGIEAALLSEQMTGAESFSNS